MVSFRSALPLVLAAALVVFEERASTPSCDVAHIIVPRARREGDGGGAVGKSSSELKVMMVGNLLIMGSDTRYLDVFFRNPFLAKFFRVFRCNCEKKLVSFSAFFIFLNKAQVVKFEFLVHISEGLVHFG